MRARPALILLTSHSQSKPVSKCRTTSLTLWLLLPVPKSVYDCVARDIDSQLGLAHASSEPAVSAWISLLG